MRRKHVSIDDDLAVALERLAAATGKPEAAHIRAALQSYVEAHPAPPPAADPLAELVGLVDDADDRRAARDQPRDAAGVGPAGRDRRR